MPNESRLRRTEVHRNLDYRFTIFGIIDAFDAIIVGTIAMFAMLVCFFFGYALAWGAPVFISGCLAMITVRAGSAPDDLIIKLRAALSPRHLSILNPEDPIRPFCFDKKGVLKAPGRGNHV